MDVITAQLFKRLTSRVLNRYRYRTGIAQKLDRLDMLVTKIRSVIEVSEMAPEIKSEHLRKWQKIFRDDATQGEEVLHELRRQISSSSSSSSGIFTCLQGLGSWKEGEKLRNAIEVLERDSREVKDFLKVQNAEVEYFLKMQKFDLSEAKKELCQEEVVDQLVNEQLLSDKPKNSLSKRKHEELDEVEELAKGTYVPCSFEFLLPTRKREELDEVEALAEGQLLPYNPENHLPTRKSEEFDEAEELAEWQFPPDDPEYLLPTRTREELAKVANRRIRLQMPLYYQQNYSRVSEEVADRQLSPDNPGNLLSMRLSEEVSVVKALAARLQEAVDKTEPIAYEDDSWFSRWIAKMTEAKNEADSVVSSIRSHDSCVDDQILDEVRVILTNVHTRLESMVDDLGDFNSLAEAQNLVRVLQINAP